MSTPYEMTVTSSGSSHPSAIQNQALIFLLASWSPYFSQTIPPLSHFAPLLSTIPVVKVKSQFRACNRQHSVIQEPDSVCVSSERAQKRQQQWKLFHALTHPGKRFCCSSGRTGFIRKFLFCLKSHILSANDSKSALTCFKFTLSCF